MPNYDAQKSIIVTDVTLDDGELLEVEDYDSEDSDGMGSTMSLSNVKSEYSVLVLGVAELGKSALVSRFMDKDIFVKNYTETMVDQYKQLMFMLDNKGVKNRQVNLNIKDVGHRFVNDTMMDGADAFVVCFDITNTDSFFAFTRICSKL